MTHTPRSLPASPSALRRQRRLVLQSLGAMPLLAWLAGCGSSSGGDADSAEAVGPAGGSGSAGGIDTGAAPAPGNPGTGTATALAFVHPGLLHTEADFTRMREKIAAGAQPWMAGWDALQKSGRAQLGRDPTPVAVVVRGGDGENFRLMVEDVQRAYEFALRWKVSGDTAYADQAVKYLDAWSSTLTQVTGNSDRFLAAGLYGYQWANAGEIMRTYAGWSAEGLARLQKMLAEIFYPMCHSFLLTHNSSNITNYWANWDMCSVAAIQAIGVFCDRRDLYNEALAYWKGGRGNGAIAHSVYCLHPGHLGQWQETARDQGHTTLSLGLTALVCEMAWNQGDDLYGYWNNRFLAGAEYVAQANLRDDSGALYAMPFARYANRQGVFTALSDAGRPNGRPIWESIYNHYVNRKGLAAPWVARIAAQQRPQRLEWVGDVPSFGTLPYSRDPFTGVIAPSGLTAYPTAGQVLLSWWGSANATGYQVQRARSANGPFTTIANVTDPRTFTDAPGDGVWYYAVSALGSGSESGRSNVVRVALPTELRLRLALDDGSGTTAADSSGHGLAGTLAGGAGWGEGRKGGAALSLDGKTGHLALPAGVMAPLGDFTLALWAYWNGGANFARVFDFGSSDIAYMALIARDGSGLMRFSVTGTSNFGEQTIAAAGALPIGRWVHLAVTLSGRSGRLYVDGVEAGRNDAIDLAPFQLGDTQQNWLGRSQYQADPYFNGRLQDLRLYSGALAAAEVAALAAG
jgi:hypothetical protein